MNITIQPTKLSGTVTAIPSKSQAHRLLLCAALADKPTRLECSSVNNDIECTANCLNALGARIERTDYGYFVTPIQTIPKQAVLDCQESGSTLRFLLPVAGALGVDTQFQMFGRLPYRPLSPLWEEMERMGCKLSRVAQNVIRCEGKLKPGEYSIAGNISSQFVTGLLYAICLLPGESRIKVIGRLESRPYVSMTQAAMHLFGVSTKDLCVSSRQIFKSPGSLIVEGDWSNAAFFLAAGALENPVSVSNLDVHSAQGDRAVMPVLASLDRFQTISAADIPDLIPVLSVVAAARQGAQFTDIARLRLKESDRVTAIISMIENLGGKAEATENSLTVYGTGLTGGTVDSRNDHRIAMSAAIAATVCKAPVTVLDAGSVNKSYPQFWREYRRLGGMYE